MCRQPEGGGGRRMRIVLPAVFAPRDGFRLTGRWNGTCACYGPGVGRETVVRRGARNLLTRSVLLFGSVRGMSLVDSRTNSMSLILANEHWSLARERPLEINVDSRCYFIRVQRVG